MVTRAREMQAENFADELIEISDDGSNDWMNRETQAGRIIRVLDHEHVQRSRLRVDTRIRMMEKFSPEKYGQRQQLTGANGTLLFERLSKMTEEERLAEAAELIAIAKRKLEMDALSRGTMSEAQYTEEASGGIGAEPQAGENGDM